jgi:hypothetical protein
MNRWALVYVLVLCLAVVSTFIVNFIVAHDAATALYTGAQGVSVHPILYRLVDLLVLVPMVVMYRVHEPTVIPKLLLQFVVVQVITVFILIDPIDALAVVVVAARFLLVAAIYLLVVLRRPAEYSYEEHVLLLLAPILMVWDVFVLFDVIAVLSGAGQALGVAFALLPLLALLCMNGGVYHLLHAILLFDITFVHATTLTWGILATTIILLDMLLFVLNIIHLLSDTLTVDFYRDGALYAILPARRPEESVAAAATTTTQQPPRPRLVRSIRKPEAHAVPATLP